MNDDELKAMRKSFKTVYNRKKQLINTPEIKKLQKKVIDIRKKSIENNEKLIEISKKSFKENDIKYYFAKDDYEANKIIFNLVKNQNVVAKSKSNTLGELGISKHLEEYGIDVVETDLGDRILQLKSEDNKPSHPTGPASHLNIEQITEIVNDSLEKDIKADPKVIMETIKEDVLNKLANCEIGISGANSIASSEGSIVLIHNEGNISLISLMNTHIIVAGRDKFVEKIEDAVSIAKLETVYATGSLVTSYMNIISGPSKTADIEKKLLKNMYGASKIIVIILDNGRSEAIDDCLLCVGCGSCIVTCPVYNAVGNEFGFNNYLGGRGVAMSKFIEDEKTSFDSGLYMCTLCGLCTINCPVSIPTNELIEKIRLSSQKQGFYPKSHGTIRENIQKKGSPY